MVISYYGGLFFTIMDLINIQHGFQAIFSNLNFNISKGNNLYKSGHVFDVLEQKLSSGISIITAFVIRQTSVSAEPYKVTLEVKF